jgi:glycosyltransferase involved in cell wall biosynthesis
MLTFEPLLDIEGLDWDIANGGPCVPILGDQRASRRRALVAYLPGALGPAAYSSLDFSWSNTGQIRCVVQCLNGLGFTVDLIHAYRVAPPPRNDYEVFLGHPGPAFDCVHQCLPSSVPRIYLATEAYREVHQRNAQERSRRCELRRGFVVLPDRPSTGSDSALSVCDAILGNGGEWTKSTYPELAYPAFIHNAAYPDRVFLASADHRNLGEPRGVLYFGGSGPLHKGLDVILDAVTGTDIELHVCSLLSPQFEEVYRKELWGLPNVHCHGWVQLRSIVARCSFGILASCSEGSPGSVAQMLQFGLIPVLTRESGFELPDAGLTIQEAHPEDVRELLLEACAWRGAGIADRRRNILDGTAGNYAPLAYRERLMTALRRIFGGLGVGDARYNGFVPKV